MKSAIVVFPGSNRERDISMALERSTGRVPAIVWHRDTELPDTDLIVIPGGFAYGDYLRCGAMAAHSPIMGEIKRRASRGTPVLGVCNGFQVLTEAGMLPGVLLSNKTLKFHCKDVHLRVETSQTLFTSGYEQGQVLDGSAPFSGIDPSVAGTPGAPGAAGTRRSTLTGTGETY